jgi:hypothetical protein
MNHCSAPSPTRPGSLSVSRLLPWALIACSAILVTACDTMPQDIAAKLDVGKADKAKYTVEMRLLTFEQVKAKGEKNSALNDRLKKVAPTMAYTPGEAAPHIVIPAAAVAGFAAQELVEGLGILLSDEAKKHSAQFGAYIQEPSWWDLRDRVPQYGALELTRTKVDAGKSEVVFDFIAILRPAKVAYPASETAPIPDAYQLIPVYLLETETAAKDFGKTIGAVIAIHLESAFTNQEGVPLAESFDYAVPCATYKVGEEYLFAKAKGPDATDAKDADDQSDYSHFFALPGLPSTLGAQICVVETDPSIFVKVLAEVGQALQGQASNAGNAVKNKLSE